MEKLTIYEAHVYDLTAQCQYVEPEHRGTFYGACHPYIIDHLLKLGVNCIQFMPVFAAKGTHWNYDPISWFELNPEFGTLNEFKLMLEIYRAHGIKVILDCVYNHTHGKMKGVTYYDWDVTGCGNTVNVKESLPIIMESIDYWFNDVGIDGIRFDLAGVLGREGGNFNPYAQFFKELERHKDKILIAEPYDIAEYSLGRFPYYMLELNTKIRDAVRQGGTYFCGDNYKKYIGFAVNHDGFVLDDVVSYNEKHNEKNGEDNRDGSNCNYSNNHGVEGKTNNQWIIDARNKTKRRIMENLRTSCYHISILMGDEMCRTQNGNNNDYLYGTPLNWSDLEANKDWFNLYCKLIK